MTKRLAIVLLLLLTLPGIAHAQLTTSLISYWSLESAGTWTDDTGANPLTNNNSVTAATGLVGNAASFASASTKFLSHASNTSLQMGNIDFTICGHFYWTSTSNMILVSKDDSAGSARDYTIDIISSKVNFYVNGGAIGIATSTVLLTPSTWYFFCGWHDATADTMNISVNNETPVAASTGGTAPQVSSAVFEIGARQYSGAEGYFDGLIDQVGIWKRTLTPTERTFLYNSGAGRTYAAIGGGGTGGGAGIAFDASAACALTTSTCSATITGTNPVVLAACFDDTGGSNLMTAIAWNTSEALTKIAQVKTPSDRWVSLWYRLAPSTGTHNLTFTTTAAAYRCAELSLTGVLALDTSTTNTATTAATVSSTMTVAANTWIVSVIRESGGTTVSWTNATERQAPASSGLHLADSASALTGSQVTTGGVGGSTPNFGIVSASFTAAGAGGSAHAGALSGMGHF